MQADAHGIPVQAINQSPSPFVSSYLVDCALVQFVSFVVLV